MPCCRFYPGTENDDAPISCNGLKQVREGEYFTDQENKCLKVKTLFNVEMLGMEKDLLDAEAKGEELVRGSVPQIKY